MSALLEVLDLVFGLYVWVELIRHFPGSEVVEVLTTSRQSELARSLQTS